MRKPATLDNWIETSALAWRWLCEGEQGVSVNPNEPWASAISRVAATILADSGYGLERGYHVDAWDEVTRTFARRASCSLDGRVQGPLARVYPNSLPAEPEPGPTYEERVQAEWEKVPVFE